MNRHMAGLSTDGTGTGTGGSVCVCVLGGRECCRGEAAHAEVTDWNNGPDERQSCLGFREQDYWTSRSFFFIRLDDRDGGTHWMAEVCKPLSQSLSHARVSSQLFKSVTEHNAEQIHFVSACACAASVCVCAAFHFLLHMFEGMCTRFWLIWIDQKTHLILFPILPHKHRHTFVHLHSHIKKYVYLHLCYFLKTK